MLGAGLTIVLGTLTRLISIVSIILKFLSETGYDGITIATLPQFTTSLDSLDKNERKRILNLSKNH